MKINNSYIHSFNTQIYVPQNFRQNTPMSNNIDSVSFRGRKYFNDNIKIIEDIFDSETDRINKCIEDSANKNLSDEEFIDKIKNITINGLTQKKQHLALNAEIKNKYFGFLGGLMIDYFPTLLNKQSPRFQPEIFINHPVAMKRALRDTDFYSLLKTFVLDKYRDNSPINNIQKEGKQYYYKKLRQNPDTYKETYITDSDKHKNFSTEESFRVQDYFGVLAYKFLYCLKDYHRQLDLQKVNNLKLVDQEARHKTELMFKITNAREHLLLDYIENVAICKELKKLNTNAFNELLPNSIVIAHSEKSVQDDVLNWLVENVKCNKSKIVKTQDLKHNELASQIRCTLEDNEEVFNKTGVPSFLYIENFENFIKKGIPRYQLAQFKNLMESAWSKYHTTIVFTTNDIKSLDNISKQPHRAMVLDIEHDPIITRLAPIKDENINVFKDGYRLKYGKEEDGDYVDIYLGCFGTARDILWVDSKYTGDVKIVLNSLDIIKQRNLFKDVTKIQCACNEVNRLLALGFRPLNDVNTEGVRIFEKKV